MRCPTLAELPSPPSGKIGWPWTIESQELPERMPDGRQWPRISIVTPSYNQGEFIEETIRSVLLQGYPNLEYIIIDGGSTDNTNSVVQNYKKWIHKWISEPDGGQPHAINKGLCYVTGTVFNFINSDDVLCQDALREIGRTYEPGLAIAAGVTQFGRVDEVTYFNQNLTVENLLLRRPGTVYRQQGLWFDVNNLRKLGPLREDLQYAFDSNIWIRYLFVFPKLSYAPVVVAKFRYHNESKSVLKRREFDEDGLRYIREMSKKYEFKRVWGACSIWIRRIEWYQSLAKVRESSENRGWKVIRILWGMLLDPRIRMTKLSLGAIRRALLK